MKKISIDLANKSATELTALSKKAAKLAEDLRKEQPSYELALANGCYDKGYNTTANGYISSYGGEAIVTMDNGKKWRCVGHGATGNAYYANDGYIEFIPIVEQVE